jgi:hypothetical protein
MGAHLRGVVRNKQLGEVGVERRVWSVGPGTRGHKKVVGAGAGCGCGVPGVGMGVGVGRLYKLIPNTMWGAERQKGSSCQQDESFPSPALPIRP